jgi:hypothetical protein
MMHVCGKGHNLISKVNTIKNLKIVTWEKVHNVRFNVHNIKFVKTWTFVEIRILFYFILLG